LFRFYFASWESLQRIQHSADTAPVKLFATPVLTISYFDPAKKRDVRLVNFHYERISWNPFEMLLSGESD
jgi:hypothetical protein